MKEYTEVNNLAEVLIGDESQERPEGEALVQGEIGQVDQFKIKTHPRLEMARKRAEEAARQSRVVQALASINANPKHIFPVAPQTDWKHDPQRLAAAEAKRQRKAEKAAARKVGTT